MARLLIGSINMAASVRGSDDSSDSIAVFNIDARGDIAIAADFAACGKCPRDFDFTHTGRRPVVLDQDSDNVIAFGFDAGTALPTGHVGTPFAMGYPRAAMQAA